jgi:hypothetical protein
MMRTGICTSLDVLNARRRYNRIAITSDVRIAIKTTMKMKLGTLTQLLENIKIRQMPYLFNSLVNRQTRS